MNGINLNINRNVATTDVELECITFSETFKMRNQSRSRVERDFGCVRFSSSGFGGREAGKCVDFTVKPSGENWIAITRVRPMTKLPAHFCQLDVRR